uniref:NAD-dependent epimerase/dehydratase domain-containing protein n=1 Tax=viral metagenome TaxID=1070528 RepID=A0A6C0DQL5_9ZZZZ
MSILVTGGLGYIGSHLTKVLRTNYNYDNIIVVDNLSTGTTNNSKFCTFLNVDITDFNSLETVFNDFKIDCVFHIAGKAFVKESFEKTNEYYNTNVLGTINILNLMVKYNVNKLVFSSSCAVYGNSNTFPINENSPVNPISPYGNTKRICEEIIQDYSKYKDINTIILRYFNVAGNDFECEVSDVSKNMGRIIPTIILKIMNDETIYINGNTYNTIDGTCSRTYIHVVDLAEAHVKCLQLLEGQKNSGVHTINVGTTKCYTILEIIDIVEKKINKTANYCFNDKIEGDPDIVYCDNTLSKDLLQFEPKYDIGDIIDSCVKYLQIVK